MQTLISYIKQSQAFKAFCLDNKRQLSAEGLDGFPLFVYALMCSKKSDGRVWIICPTKESAKQLYINSEIACKSLSVADNTVFLDSVSRGIYTYFSGQSDEYKQLRELSDIEKDKHCTIVTDIKAFCCSVPNIHSLNESNILIKVNESLDTMALAQRLSECGYYRTDRTSSPGEFTIRGEVVDVFPYGVTRPYRIFLDWDKVQKICDFEVFEQSIISTFGHIEIQTVSSESSIDTSYRGILNYISESDYFIFCGDQRLLSSYDSLFQQAKNEYRTAWQKDHDAEHPDMTIVDFPSFMQNCRGSLTIRDISGRDADAFKFGIEAGRSYFGNFSFLEEDLKGLEDNKWSINIYCLSQTQQERLVQMLGKFKSVNVLLGNISSGFAIPDRAFIVMTESEIFGRRKQIVKTLQHTKTSVLDSFVELKEGDYVVHVNYGIGVFIKIDRIRERDYIKIQFADKETLFVPIEQSNLIQKYIGSAGEDPRLDKLGSLSWENKKAKARQSAEKLAKDLVELYARRRSSHGFAFERDNDWQLRFEAMFDYEETEDQIKCIQDIKQDMESSTVMDRLICGDVGYGKTEVAFRAVFKAVMSGKQVAFLAPTTILAQQHYRNFCDRINDFPLRCSLLTRMITAKEQGKCLEQLKAGNIDVLFGTHRIIQKDVVFSSLGLLVVDEEQRFGVKDKEKIKQLKSNIDCLTLSATPIPRTLYMSLLKIRDMSLLTTAPIQRKAIRTVVDSFDIDTIIKAIKFEIARKGQVFYLHNRIDTLESVASVLRDSLPDVAIETAHGQMKGEALEKTMERFIDSKTQVLVSTTIIENGIDIPNVNTIIIDRADMYGVSQLYQLRGRVGRSDIEAWAYLFYPAEHVLKEDAIKRLQIISEHTELGSGFKVAMKDMEMRGAGNLLGKEQSGFMSVVGLDMYIRLLDEEVSKIQNDGVKPESEVFLDLDYSGFIPDSYISDAAVKFEVYKKIASTNKEGDVEILSSELSDRFGPMPDEVGNLLYLCELRIVCKKLEIYHVKERKGIVSLEFSNMSSVPINKVIEMIKTGNGSVTVDSKHPNELVLKTEAISLKDKVLFILEKLQRLLV